MDNHEEWCKRVSKKYLKKRKIEYKQYRKEFLCSAFPMDLLGIGIFARAYKKHVAVFYDTKFWCTEINRDLSKVHIFLLYAGKMDFENTRRMHVWEYNNTRDIMQKFQTILDKEQEYQELTSTSGESTSEEFSEIEDTDAQPDPC